VAGSVAVTAVAGGVLGVAVIAAVSPAVTSASRAGKRSGEEGKRATGKKVLLFPYYPVTLLPLSFPCRRRELEFQSLTAAQ
jgi:hypothetical protein